jgi:hypothetical protein
VKLIEVLELPFPKPVKTINKEPEEEAERSGTIYLFKLRKLPRRSKV